MSYGPTDERRFKRRLDEVPAWQRETVESVARQLMTVGAYTGSETDAVTDALAILNSIFGGIYVAEGEGPLA